MSPREIRRDEVGRLVAQGAQLVEVLPRSAWEQEHLPGAVSLPLAGLDRDAAAGLPRDRPVIVYCFDYQ
jgi:rhodanese-related sulfurtransferase